jgi:hypothetical protein
MKKLNYTEGILHTIVSKPELYEVVAKESDFLKIKTNSNELKLLAKTLKGSKNLTYQIEGTEITIFDWRV